MVANSRQIFALAGCGLLAGGAIAGLVGVYDGAYLDIRKVILLQAEGGKHGLQSVGQYAFFALLFQFLHSLCPAHISGVAAGECEGGELQRVGTARGRFTRWYQLIGGGHGIQQNAGHVQQKIFAKRWYIGPLGYIGAEPEGLVLLSPAKAEVYTPVVDCVAAMDRASISMTPESWPSAGFEPSRLGKLRVV